MILGRLTADGRVGPRPQPTGQVPSDIKLDVGIRHE